MINAAGREARCRGLSRTMAIEKGRRKPCGQMLGVAEKWGRPLSG
jgi:hypothetical protein